MDNDSIDRNKNKNMDKQVIHDNNLQKPKIYNKYLPFHEFIEQQGYKLFDEIRENLSRTIQLGELHPASQFGRVN